MPQRPSVSAAARLSQSPDAVPGGSKPSTHPKGPKAPKPSTPLSPRPFPLTPTQHLDQGGHAEVHVPTLPGQLQGHVRASDQLHPARPPKGPKSKPETTPRDPKPEALKQKNRLSFKESTKHQQTALNCIPEHPGSRRSQTLHPRP